MIDVCGTYSALRFLMDGDAELVFRIPAKQRAELMSGIDEILSKGVTDLRITAKKKVKKRSLDANDYLWVLCTKIAEKLQDSNTMVTKEEVYRRHIEAVGKYEPLAIAEDSVDRFLAIWQRNGTGWLAKVVDSKLDGCKKVFAYYGSSVYDTKEMSRLIDSVIEDCRALEIETMPPMELDALLNEWGMKSGGKP